FQHGSHCLCLVDSVSQEQDVSRREYCFEADRHSLLGRVSAAKPFVVCHDRNRIKRQQSSLRFLRASRFVKTEVAVLAKPKDNDIQPSPLFNGLLMPPNAFKRVGFQRTHGMKLRLRNFPRIGGGSPEKIRAIARLIQWNSDVLVEREKL